MKGKWLSFVAKGECVAYVSIPYAKDTLPTEAELRELLESPEARQWWNEAIYDSEWPEDYELDMESLYPFELNELGEEI